MSDVGCFPQPGSRTAITTSKICGYSTCVPFSASHRLTSSADNSVDQPAGPAPRAEIRCWPQVLIPKGTFATQLPNTLFHTTNRSGSPRSVHGFIFRPVQAQHEYEFAIGSGEPVGLPASSGELVLNVQVR